MFAEVFARAEIAYRQERLHRYWSTAPTPPGRPRRRRWPRRVHPPVTPDSGAARAPIDSSRQPTVQPRLAGEANGGL